MQVNPKDRILKIGLIALLAGILLTPSAYSVLTSSITVPSSGYIMTGNEIVAQSGSVTDIQAAVDVVAMAGGGTVHIPAGNFTFNLFASANPRDGGGQLTGVKVPGGVNVIGAGNNQTILYTPTNCWRSGGNAVYGDRLFYLDGSNGRPIRISGIVFQGSVNYSSTLITTYGSNPDSADGGAIIGIYEYGVTDFRIDHCTFLDFSNAAVAFNSKFATPREGNCGLIDHCIIDNPYKNIYWNITGYYPLWGYGFIVNGAGWNDGIWRDKSEIFGKYGPEIVYIEDNSFARCRHDIAAAGQGSDAYYVARYNNFTDNVREHYCSFIDAHPGARGFEAYNNNFINVPLDYRSLGSSWGSINNRASTPYSGSGLFYNNRIEKCSVGVLFTSISTDKEKVDGWWVWGNTLVNTNTLVSIGSSNYPIRENIEYFLRSPNQDQDGFTYTPYQYPFPLTVSGMLNPVSS